MDAKRIAELIERNRGHLDDSDFLLLAQSYLDLLAVNEELKIGLARMIDDMNHHVLVPREPTEEMLVAGSKEYEIETNEYLLKRIIGKIYKAMIDKA